MVIAKNVPLHRQFEVKLFTNPNGELFRIFRPFVIMFLLGLGAPDNDNDYPIRCLLSSYYFPQNQARGIPDGKSDCSLCKVTCDGCQTVPYSKAYDANSCGYDEPVYTRTHRDKTVIMAMRKWMHLSTNVTNAQVGLPNACN